MAREAEEQASAALLLGDIASAVHEFTVAGDATRRATEAFFRAAGSVLRTQIEESTG